MRDSSVRWVLGSVPVKGNWQGHDNNGNANQEIVEGVLRAYDASTFAGTDSRPGVVLCHNSFCPPVVADGKVLLATYDAVIWRPGLSLMVAHASACRRGLQPTVRR